MSENQLNKILSMLTLIEDRLSNLERICSHTNVAMNAAIPRTRKSLAPMEIKLTPEEIKNERRQKVIQTFLSVVASPREAREKFTPNYLLEEKGNPPFGALAFSALVNRLYGLAIFKAIPKYNETTAIKNAEKAIEESGLTICTVSELCLRKGEAYVESDRRVVLNAKAAHKYLGINAEETKEETVDDDKIWKPKMDDNDRIWKPAPAKNDDLIWKPTPKVELADRDEGLECPVCDGPLGECACGQGGLL